MNVIRYWSFAIPRSSLIFFYFKNDHKLRNSDRSKHMELFPNVRHSARAATCTEFSAPMISCAMCAQPITIFSALLRISSRVEAGNQNKAFVITTFSSHIFLRNIPKVPQKPKVILTKLTFSRTPKCHVFPIFSEMSRSDIGFTDSDSVAA